MAAPSSQRLRDRMHKVGVTRRSIGKSEQKDMAVSVIKTLCT
jgi:hypothetical protein